MLVDLFDFELPEQLIAQGPVSPRDSAKLLEINHKKFSDHVVKDLHNLLRPNDLLVFNDTKVIPSRLIGARGEARVEVTLHKKTSDNSWKAFAKPARKMQIGETFKIDSDFFAEVIDKLDGGEVELKFNVSGATLNNKIEHHGIMPLPPYINRKTGSRESDKLDYQTLFAKEAGAVAAPTAGLHFTKQMFDNLEKKNVKHCFVTLHVGAGTFLPVKTENTTDHIMHSEWYSISQETADKINNTKQAGGRIIAIGTTSLRTLEASSNADGTIAKSEADTDIFITPGYKFKIVDLLLTNFHLPRSTLFMLVSAFAGRKNMQDAYKHAIDNSYRFYSYGDTSLIHRNDVNDS